MIRGLVHPWGTQDLIHWQLLIMQKSQFAHALYLEIQGSILVMVTAVRSSLIEEESCLSCNSWHGIAAYCVSRPSLFLKKWLYH